MWNYGIVLFILCSVAILSVRRGKLTAAAAVTGCVLGFFIFLGAGYIGIAMIATFFMLGTVATSWKLALKEKLKVAERKEVRRKWGQVIANAGVAGILGLLVQVFPDYKALFQLMMAASLASATADTLSSELGNVYGKKFYNIRSFKPDQRGLDGVVSLEGTLIGVAGSFIIALIYAVGFGWSLAVLWIVIAGTIGNLSDSLLGATLERRNYLTNNAVNFLNTLLAAMAGFLLSFL